MSVAGLVAVIAVIGVVAFGLGVLVGRGPVRRRREADMSEIVDRAVAASSEKMEQTAQQASSPIVEKAIAIEARLRDVRQGVTEIRAGAEGDRQSISTQLQGVADTARRLTQVLDKPASRGSWGEWIVDQALQSAGFVEGVNYDIQKKQSNGGKPDFTIYLPNGLKLHVDAKTPGENLAAFEEASDDNDRERAKKAFVRNVDTMVKNLASRNYTEAEDSVDIVVMCIPNESIYASMHEADPNIIEKSLKLGVVLCSISTLFAVLGIVRQAVKNFQLEARTSEVLSCIDDFRQEWARFVEQLNKADSQLGTFSKSWDALKGTRSDKLDTTVERIRQIERSDTAADPVPGESDEESQTSTAPRIAAVD